MLNILAEHTPDHTPLYYLLVNWWAKLAGNSLAAARLISLYCGLITLALTWRMAQEFIAPVAGFFAIVVLVSNAYFAFHYAHLRNYTMMTMFGALALWLYLRLITAQRTPVLRDYLTLTLATYAMIMTHPFTLALYATIGMYHLFAVRKDRRWLPVSAAAVLSVALALPQFAVLFTDGLRHARTIFTETAESAGDIECVGYDLLQWRARVAALVVSGAHGWVGCGDSFPDRLSSGSCR